MFELPEVAPYRLGRAPLAQALAQVRFPLQARLASLEGLAVIQEPLFDRYPYLTPAPQTSGFQVAIGPGGVSQASIASNSQQFVFNGDEGFSVWIAPDSATLSVGQQYGGAEDFKQRFRELLDILAANARVPRCDRIAARYVSLASTVMGGGWRNQFRPEVLGWTGAGVLSPKASVSSSVNQVQLQADPTGPLADFPAGVTGLIHNGLLPPGATVNGIPPIQVESESYVMDLDIFCLSPQPWVPERLISQFGALHDQIDRFFHWSLTDGGKSDFEYEEIEA